MTLYEINQNIMSLIDEETGEITDIVYYDALRQLMANAKENLRQAGINLDDALTDGTSSAEEKDLAQARYDAAVNLYVKLINLPFEYEEEDEF